MEWVTGNEEEEKKPRQRHLHKVQRVAEKGGVAPHGWLLGNRMATGDEVHEVLGRRRVHYGGSRVRVAQNPTRARAVKSRHEAQCMEQLHFAHPTCQHHTHVPNKFCRTNNIHCEALPNDYQRKISIARSCGKISLWWWLSKSYCILLKHEPINLQRQPMSSTRED